MGFPPARPYYMAMHDTPPPARPLTGHIRFSPPARRFIFAFGQQPINYPLSAQHQAPADYPSDGKDKQIPNFGVHLWKPSLLSEEVPVA